MAWNQWPEWRGIRTICLILSVFIVFSLVSYVNFAFAGEVTLEWDRNSEPDVVGYKIHYGTSSGAYTTTIDVGNYTSCTISGLDEDTTYYFTGKAYNTAGAESDFSNEVSAYISNSDTNGGGGYLLEAYFDSGAEGFNYEDDTFRSTGKPDYAQGTWVDAGGSGGGALQVSLGGIDTADIVGMSGGWEKTITLNQSGEMEITFFYNFTQTSEYESDEFSQVLVSVDGVLYGQGGNDYVDQMAGNGPGGGEETTGWQSCTVTTGTLAAGEHSLIIGGYNNKKTHNDESTQILIDDVIVSGGN